MEGFQKILEKYQLEKWFRKENLIVLVLSGILLVVIALPVKEDSAKENLDTAMQEDMQGMDSDGLYKMYHTDSADLVMSNEDSGFYAAVDYITYLEGKLADILSQAEGAGNVSVMITLQESEELVVEEDQPIKTILPKVEGVVVIAPGADDGAVKKTITEMVQALFDIDIHKIKVVGSS